MADEHTPTTEDVREASSLNGGIAVEPDAFDRWLAAHDRETAERTLRDAARAAVSRREPTVVDDHTPTTTEDVRLVYGSDERGILRDLWVTRFDRWIKEHDRETAARAWDEGAEAGYDDAEAGREEKHNPYREGDPT